MNTEHQATDLDLQQGFTVKIPCATDSFELTLKAGVANIFIGANGSGKTRLGVYIEEQLIQSCPVYRIAANRVIQLQPNQNPMSNDKVAIFNILNTFPDGNQALRLEEVKQYKQHYQQEKMNLNFGYIEQGSKKIVGLQNDFNPLISFLYKDNANISHKFRQASRQASLGGSKPEEQETILEQVKSLWDSLLPHRTLDLSQECDIQVTTKHPNEGYSASEMSDGERVIFYLIARVFIHSEPTVFIIDEPELHINPSLMNDLWTAIEQARPDCCFVYVTHDMNFAQRHEAAKYAIFSYDKVNDKEQWQLSNIKKDDAIPEDLMFRIIGSRRPILLVEGKQDSLDYAVYSAVYDKFQVMYMESCQNVISTVKSFNNKKSKALHGVEMRGLIDGDGRTDEQKDEFKNDKIYCSPIAQIENLFLCEEVFTVLAAQNNITDVKQAYNALRTQLEKKFKNKPDLLKPSITKIIKLKIDRIKFQEQGDTIEDIKKYLKTYIKNLNDLNPDYLFNEKIEELTNAIKNNNYDHFFKLYQGKDCLSLLNGILNCQKAEKKVLDSLKSKVNSEKLIMALREILPRIEAD